MAGLSAGMMDLQRVHRWVAQWERLLAATMVVLTASYLADQMAACLVVRKAVDLVCLTVDQTVEPWVLKTVGNLVEWMV